MKKQLRHLIYGAIIVFTVQSCDFSYLEGEIEDFEHSASYALPLGKITYTVKELFEEIEAEDLVISQNSEDVVTFVYTDTLAAQSAADFVEIPNQSFASSIDLGVTTAGSLIQVTVPIPKTQEIFTFNTPSGEEFDSIVFNGGTFDINISPTFATEIELTVTISSLKDKNTGVAFQETQRLTPSSPSFIISEDLVNYLGDFTDDGAGGVTSNSFVLSFTGAIYVEVGDVISSSDRLNLNVTLSNPEFETIYGDLKTQSLDVGNQIINFDVFEEFGEGGLTFANPSLRFITENSFGFPIGINFGGITATNSASVSETLTGSIASTPQRIAAPTVSQLGQVIKDTITINKENSNIVDLLAIKPNQFAVNITAASNPASAPAEKDFISNTSALNAFVQVDMPLDVVFDDIVFEQEMDDFNGEDLEDFTELKLQLSTVNTMPMGGTLEMVFYDSSNTVVYTVSEQAAFEPAPIDANGFSSGSVNNTSTFVINAQSVTTAKKIVLKLKLNTTDSSADTAVKMLSTNTLAVNIAVEAGISLNSN